MSNEVTKEDREAAADLLDEISALLDHNGIGQVADLIRDGEYDEHEAAQAFARHRQSSLSTAMVEMRASATEMADLVERLTDAVERETHDIGGEGSLTVLREIGPAYNRLRTALSKLSETDNG